LALAADEDGDEDEADETAGADDSVLEPLEECPRSATNHTATNSTSTASAI
jgi:hypothetical protein